MKKKVIILLTACICSISAFTQDSYLKDRWNFKLSGSTGPLYSQNVKKTPQIRAEANYGLLNYLEIGGYLGVSNYWKYYDVYTDTVSGQFHYSSKKRNSTFLRSKCKFSFVSVSDQKR